MAERTVIIAGAGIAGLTAALSFAAKGFSVTIFERSNELQEAGAGLQISPNATRILKRLGVLERLEANAVQPSSLTLRRAADLKELARLPLGTLAEERWSAPYLVAHRADLQRALLEVVRANPEIRLELGAEVTDASFAKKRPVASVQRGNGRHEETADLLVGADGVWSTLRDTVDPGRGRFSGYVAFRTVLDVEGLPHHATVFAPDTISAFLAQGFHLVAYPLRGGREINLVAVIKGADLETRWENDVDTAHLNSALQKAAPGLAATVREADWRAWPIHTAFLRENWTPARGLCLIGDAAHAMTPYAAQGAAMAIEDAAMLAGLLAESDDLPSTLMEFKRLRRPRIERVARRASFNRFVWHARGPVVLGRDFVLRRRTGEDLAADMDWLYGYDVENEIAAQTDSYAAI